MILHRDFGVLRLKNRICVCYQNYEWAYSYFYQILNALPHDCVINISDDFVHDEAYIELKDGSSIIFHDIKYLLGQRYDKIIYESGIPTELVDTIIAPCLCRSPLIEVK